MRESVDKAEIGFKIELGEEINQLCQTLFGQFGGVGQMGDFRGEQHFQQTAILHFCENVGAVAL